MMIDELLLLATTTFLIGVIGGGGCGWAIQFCFSVDNDSEEQVLQGRSYNHWMIALDNDVELLWSSSSSSWRRGSDAAASMQLLMMWTRRRALPLAMINERK